MDKRPVTLFTDQWADLPFEELALRAKSPSLAHDIIRMIDRNEYKRRQAPPGVKISPRAFGRDRRMPITSGWKS